MFSSGELNIVCNAESPYTFYVWSCFETWSSRGCISKQIISHGLFFILANVCSLGTKVFIVIVIYYTKSGVSRNLGQNIEKLQQGGSLDKKKKSSCTKYNLVCVRPNLSYTYINWFWAFTLCVVLRETKDHRDSSFPYSFLNLSVLTHILQYTTNWGVLNKIIYSIFISEK